MTTLKFSPNCDCCGFECLSEVFPKESFPDIGWSSFEINEGQLGVFSTSPVTLSSGQRMRPKSRILSPRSEAWYHRIRFTGDIDIEWDGIAIEIRPGQGVVRSNGSDIPVMPMVPTGIQATEIMLVVTPDWYGVMYFPLHLDDRGGFFGSSRGAIQIIDRINDPSVRPVTLTMASASGSVVRWTVADMSVVIRGDEIVEQCQRPTLPDGTEQLMLSQNQGFYTNTFSDYILFSPFARNTSSIPDTINSSPHPIYSQTPGAQTLTDYRWRDIVFIPIDFSLPSEIAPLFSFRGGTNNGTNGSRTGPHREELFFNDQGIMSGGRSSIGLQQQVLWRRQTVANPYPKPESYTQVVVVQASAGLIVRGFSLSNYDNLSKAPSFTSAQAASLVTWSTL